MTYKKFIEMSGWQRQIVYGSILGGATIIKKSRNAHLMMRSNNFKWLQCKSQELLEFLPQNPILDCKTGTFIWHSICSPVFNEIYNLFYVKGKKTANQEILNSLQAIGLSVWFLDCGKFVDGKITLKARMEQKEIVYNYFKDLDLIFETNGNKVIFNNESSIKFMKIIGESIPEFMKVKT